MQLPIDMVVHLLLYQTAAEYSITEKHKAVAGGRIGWWPEHRKSCHLIYQSRYSYTRNFGGSVGVMVVKGEPAVKCNKCSAEMGERLATIDIGRKEGGCCAPFGGAGSPSNTMWQGPRSTSIPSFILIHPAIWPQYTNVTDRTDRQTGQRSNSTGRSVLQTVARPKSMNYTPRLLVK